MKKFFLLTLAIVAICAGIVACTGSEAKGFIGLFFDRQAYHDVYRYDTGSPHAVEVWKEILEDYQELAESSPLAGRMYESAFIRSLVVAVWGLAWLVLIAVAIMVAMVVAIPLAFVAEKLLCLPEFLVEVAVGRNKISKAIRALRRKLYRYHGIR